MYAAGSKVIGGDASCCTGLKEVVLEANFSRSCCVMDFGGDFFSDFLSKNNEVNFVSVEKKRDNCNCDDDELILLLLLLRNRRVCCCGVAVRSTETPLMLFTQ